MRDPGDEARFNAASIAGRADRLLPDFRRAIEAVPRESGFKGIGPRGMFFFYAAVRPLGPKQILESGRMRGESTLILARCFPQARIVSVEYDLDSKHTTSPFVFLPPNLPASYPTLLFKIIWARAVSIAITKIGKFLPHNRSGKVLDSEG